MDFKPGPDTQKTSEFFTVLQVSPKRLRGRPSGANAVTAVHPGARRRCSWGESSHKLIVPQCEPPKARLTRRPVFNGTDRMSAQPPGVGETEGEWGAESEGGTETQVLKIGTVVLQCRHRPAR